MQCLHFLFSICLIFYFLKSFPQEKDIKLFSIILTIAQMKDISEMKSFLQVNNILN